MVAIAALSLPLPAGSIFYGIEPHLWHSKAICIFQSAVNFSEDNSSIVCSFNGISKNLKQKKNRLEVHGFDVNDFISLEFIEH